MRLDQIRLDPGPLMARIDTRAADVGMTATEWLINHPLAGPGIARVVYRHRSRGYVTAAWADRWAITLLGMTLDEIYGPDWEVLDLQEVC